MTVVDTLDPDRVTRPEPLLRTLRRRVGGRYPIDPFGLDPQLADLVSPMFTFAVRVHVAGGEHVPPTGPAVIVSNRGFGIAEPAALGVAVERSTGRRLRVIGAPSVPFLSGFARRLGAIGASEPDVGAALRAGHLVGAPLAPTWLRTGAGTPPRELLRAMTNTPIVPAAVTPAGLLRAAVGPWSVRFGPLVTLPDPYDPDDPLAAARFADAMRDAVARLLVLG